ncbi:carbon starvation CstA family protein, partial [Enterobacter hormaechei]
MESFVAIMALVAASIIEPGLYFAMNTPPAGLGHNMPNLAELGGAKSRQNLAHHQQPTAHPAGTVRSWGLFIIKKLTIRTKQGTFKYRCSPKIKKIAGGG